MKLRYDLPASLAVFLVALPLCLGIALASGAPLMSGILAGIIGGVVVGSLSGSHVSVSGPAAGLVAIVLDQVTDLGSFEAFLLAVVFAGVAQILLGVLRAGVIAYYFPSSVIRGLLTAIGVILILKQIPHAIGYDADAEGDFSFWQIDGYNTFTELGHMFQSFSVAATVVSLLGLAVLIAWERTPLLKKGPVPGALAAVVVGTLLNELLRATAPEWAIGPGHRVQLATSNGASFTSAFQSPDWSVWRDFQVYLAALTIAVVASLETLLNLEAVDRLDRAKRISPPNRELIAQGVGNICSGMVGGLPITSVIVRSSANVYAGAKTKASAILHGVWLTATVFAVPNLLERIPLSALAAILLFTGYKLANPQIIREQFAKGGRQFFPFAITVVAIVLTDLLIGILVGLAAGILFVLHSMERAPFLSTQSNPVAGNVTRLKFGQYLTFWNKSRIRQMLDHVPADSHVILDAASTEYIDPDIVELIRDFHDVKAPAKSIAVSLVGFHDQFVLDNKSQYTDVVTKTRQQELTPLGALQLLCEGNQRFRSGKMIERDWSHQRDQTKLSQHPIAALVGCIDSRVPAELVFDVGIGDVFSARVAGNVVNNDILGSLEYAAEVAGVKLIVVLGHTRCGAVAAACQGVQLGHVTALIEKISPSVKEVTRLRPNDSPTDPAFADQVAARNVQHVVEEIPKRSPNLQKLIHDGQLEIVGGLYNIEAGTVEFYGPLVERLRDEAAA